MGEEAAGRARPTLRRAPIATDGGAVGADDIFMAEAIELARRPAFASPNPRVGAVVVRSGRIIASGAHEGPGTRHAEAAALAHAGADAAGATLYITLEPCIHNGRTPPCAPEVVSSGVARVVIAMADPDERMRGRGIDALRAAGIAVECGVGQAQASALNAAYRHHRLTGTAWLTLKLALSLDGRLAAPDGSSRWITGEAARARVHRRRVEADAVMVGAGTVAADDPELTARTPGAARQPVRIVLDPAGTTPPSARVLAATGRVIMAATETTPEAALAGWRRAGAEVVIVGPRDGGVDVGALLGELGRRGMIEVMCEGGGRVATSLLRHDLVNRLELYYGPVVIGSDGLAIGLLGTESMAGLRRWHTVSVDRAGDDVVVVADRDAT